jgi:hypothetical protein
MPAGVDYPLALVLTNSTVNPHFRAQLYVNGWQFGKYGASSVSIRTSRYAFADCW